MLTLDKPLTQRHAALAVKVDQTMRAKLPELPNPLIASWDERQRLVVSRGEPWVVGPLEIDPHRTAGGGYPFPDAVAAHLQLISERGARFHRIAIAHEVDREGPVADVMPKVGAHGLVISEKDTKEYLGKTPAAEAPKKIAAAMDKVIKTGGRVAAAILEGAATAAAVVASPALDPIVFGVIGTDGHPLTGEPAIYYPLAAWKW